MSCGGGDSVEGLVGTFVLLWLRLCDEKFGSWLCRGEREKGDRDMTLFI